MNKLFDELENKDKQTDISKLLQKLSQGNMFRKQIAENFHRICSLVESGIISVTEDAGENILYSIIAMV